MPLSGAERARRYRRRNHARRLVASIKDHEKCAAEMEVTQQTAEGMVKLMLLALMDKPPYPVRDVLALLGWLGFHSAAPSEPAIDLVQFLEAEERLRGLRESAAQAESAMNQTAEDEKLVAEYDRMLAEERIRAAPRRR